MAARAFCGQGGLSQDASDETEGADFGAVPEEVERVAGILGSLRHVEDGEVEAPDGEATVHRRSLVPVYG